ncbi:MAG: hypothetical protein ACYDCP_10995 [Thermoplasmataceae archaeon]
MGYKEGIGGIDMSKGIITLCGSTRFYETFLQVNNNLTAQGYIVLSICVVKNATIMLDKSNLELEKMLNELHKEKIAMSDSIFVIDVDGYIGESTKNEIEFAKKCNKKINYYSLSQKCSQYRPDFWEYIEMF